MPTSPKGPATASRSSTSSQRAVKPEPFSVEHFAAYARLLVLDNGEQWEPEPFQLEIVADLFSDFVAVWTIIPEANGKTTLYGGLGLYWADFVPAAEVLLAAASRQQAELMYSQAAGFVRRTPGMRKRFRPYDGYRRIKSLRLEGRIQVMAADDSTGDGVLYDLALIDELHRHKNLKLYRVWKGKAQKRGGTLGVISTAGEPGGEFEDARANIVRSAQSVEREGLHVRAVSGETVLHDWAVPMSADVEDMGVVKAANPFSKITETALRAKRDDPAMTPEHWRRFVCNQAVLSGGSAVSPEEWDKLREEGVQPDRAAPAFGWLDLGWKIDTTALGALVWESDERRVIADVLVIPPPVDELHVVAGLLRLQAAFEDFRGVVYDPNAGGQQMAQLIEAGIHPLQTDDDLREMHGLERLEGQKLPPIVFIEHSQDNAPMADAAAKLDEAIRNGWIVHDGNRLLRSHVLNAISRSLGGEKWKFDRPNDAKGERRGRYPIDALTGVLMGHRTALAEAGAAESFVFEVFS
jgi:phage terminase large subunit-like protein